MSKVLDWFLFRTWILVIEYWKLERSEGFLIIEKPLNSGFKLGQFCDRFRLEMDIPAN